MKKVKGEGLKEGVNGGGGGGENRLGAPKGHFFNPKYLNV